MASSVQHTVLTGPCDPTFDRKRVRPEPCASVERAASGLLGDDDKEVVRLRWRDALPRRTADAAGDDSHPQEFNRIQ